MKVRITLLLTVSVFLAGCSQQPSYDFMVDNFNQNKPTFSMIATIACDIGEKTGLRSYAINGKTEQEKTLLELAERINVEAISYVEASGKCQLSMPVWKGYLDDSHQLFAYRYNISAPRPYNAALHRYQQIRDKEGTQTEKSKSVLFDMKLSKRWFFSFITR
ncbi:hypothetical protein OPS25_11515 [Alteromonas ponticola]|uniref:Lipoprotein n=1 Tax=Alteromonas aquimaris TaxID=2998417 RepID=A0ABT3P9C1_9ALTE|nr:hypothetical protein [Alteromonas aquimaris]MCW8109125.1 hypothetical protein [Alteromonas aquimaris]